MRNSYEQAKEQLLRIKKEIDQIVESTGGATKLSQKEEILDKIYKECIRMCNNEQNKKYINFNYYPCKAMISLSKGNKYESLKECLTGFMNFVEYVSNISDTSKYG